MPVCPRLRLLAVAACSFLTFASVSAKPVALQGSPGSVAVAQPAELNPPDIEITRGEPQFDTTPAPLPPNVPSVGFEATGTSEFGDHVRLADTAHFIDSVTITMSSWAIHSDFPGSSPLGFSHPITLRIYAVDRRAGTPKLGDPLATLTQTFLIPWRPEPDPASSSPLRPWRGADGNFYPGLAFTLTFDLGSLGLSLPDEVIFGVSFNTLHYGPAPLGVAGPYDKLHVGVAETAPTTGADVEPDAVFWRTAHGGDYADGGREGTNIFRRDAHWTPFKPAVRFNNSAYGMLAVTSARLAALPAPDARTAAALDEAQRLTSWTLERSLWDGNNRLRPAVGGLVFDLLAEAVDVLSHVTPTDAALAKQTAAEVDSLLKAAEMLAELAVGDSLIGGGNLQHFSRAQDALDEAFTNRASARHDKAMDEFGTAWREADLSLR